MRAVLIALAALALASCTPRIPEGRFACEADADCPPRMRCGTDQRCRHAVEDATTDAPTTCAVDTDCDDGLDPSCVGPERCAPGDPSADARGCVTPTESRCLDAQTCDAATERCVTDCTVTDDADGDGHAATDCGGDDCDDGRTGAYPGFPEVCDTVDDDCDPSTFGTKDADEDGAIDAACCNPGPGGAMSCGTDCDDDDGTVAPNAPETCNALDDDCDGSVDEGVIQTFFRDVDGDGVGVTSDAHTGCSPMSGYVLASGDCDDANPDRAPGRMEICNGLDDDCDLVPDDGLTCSCTVGQTQACGTDVGECAAGSQSCNGGSWGTCSAIGPKNETCNGLDDDCDTVVDDGASATCPARPNATPVCSTGSCTFTCSGSYRDCDGTVTNGCEVNSLNDVSHCGGCTACATPSQVATRICSAGQCAVQSCNSGYGNCNGTFADGCEVDVRVTTAHCGACNAPCPTATNTTVACSNSQCVYTCTSGRSNCDGTFTNGCETAYATCNIPAPRLVGPLTDSVVNSRQPALRFAAAAGTQGRVQVCRDAACADVVWTGTGASTVTVGTALAPGRYYWRTHGYVNPTVGTAVSATWRFTVFAQASTMHATFGMTYLNVSGGGDDVAIGAPTTSGGSVRLYADGGATLTQTLTVANAAGFGNAVAPAGDVNGDGYGDLVVGACIGSSDPDVVPANCAASVRIFLGQANGTFNTTPFTTIAAPAGAGAFGYSVGSAGDFDGDGYGDFVVGAYYGARAYVYLGATSAGSIRRIDLLPGGADPGDGTAGGLFGLSVAGAGDVNADGFADVVVGQPLASPNRALVYLGSAAGNAHGGQVVLQGPASTNFGISVTGLGDVNGDGIADIGVGGNGGGGYAGMFTGSAAWANGTTVTTALQSWTGVGGISVIGPGDTNGDGHGDLLVGASGTSVSLFRGGTSPSSMPLWTVADSTPRFGRWVGRAGLTALADARADALVGICDSATATCSMSVRAYAGVTSSTASLDRTWSGTDFFGAGVVR